MNEYAPIISLTKDPDRPLGGAPPIGIMELTGTTCRWPVKLLGEDNRLHHDAQWSYCGHLVGRGRYCRKHGALAYRGSPISAQVN